MNSTKINHQKPIKPFFKRRKYNVSESEQQLFENTFADASVEDVVNNRDFSGRLMFFGRNDDESEGDFVEAISRRCRLSFAEPTLNVVKEDTCNAVSDSWVFSGAVPLDHETDTSRQELGIPSIQDGYHLSETMEVPQPPIPSYSHCHSRRPKKGTSKTARNQLMISSVLCLLFMICEIVGGYFANSLAIMTDAAHLLSDFASFMISLFALWIGSKPSTKRMSFGYHRAEILGAVMSVLLIWMLTGVLVYLAILRVIHQEYVIDSNIMLIVSGTGVGINIIMALVLHPGVCCAHGHSHGHEHSHVHGHGHSHGQESDTNENVNVRAAFIHVVGDFVQSVGVLVAALIIKFKPEYKLADPICTFLFSLLVLYTTVNIFRDTVNVLMEGFPHNVDYNRLKQELENVVGVRMAHSLHVWSLTMDKMALVAHLAVDENCDFQSVLEKAEAALQRIHKFNYLTLQIERYLPVVMDTCSDCQEPLK